MGMRLALLGADVESLRLAEAALAAGHEISWPVDAAGAEPAQTSPGPPPSDSWEDLLDSETADAVIVGHGPGGDEFRARQVQDLVRLDRPILVTFPLISSVLTYFEIDMARTESGAIVQHFNPLVEAPALTDAADWVAEGHPDFGAVEQINCTRLLADRSRELVLWHFARDVEMLGRVAGRLNRIGAHAGAGGDETSYAALSVQLLGASEIPVRWSVESPADAEGMSLTLVCQRGRITFDFDASGRLVNPVPAEQSLEADAIERFVAAVESNDSATSTWLDALHAMELTDSIEISLRRGRMIDIHHQQLTEHLAFKGTMAAAGCGLLFFLLPFLLAIGWLAGQFGVPIGQFVPHLLLGLLAIFLGMQFLPKLLYREPPAKS